MQKPEIPLCADRRHRSRPQRLAGPPVRQARAGRFPGRPPDRQACRARQGDRRRGPCLQRRRAGGRCRPVRGARRQAGRTPDVVVYNASNRVRGPLVDLPPDDVKRAIEISAFGGFLVSQQAAKRMLPKSHGAIFLTGATAGVKGFALSATFAMGKFALRGLAQSMARELVAQGHPCRPFRDRRRHHERRAPGAGQRARQPARSRRHRRDLLGHAAAAPQRLELGGRGQAVGREVLA